jgi:aspartyl-tRNA(Asn)/glutamyl-tRNA(Gln) amidotransferase subunit B
LEPARLASSIILSAFERVIRLTLASWVDEVLAGSPAEVARYRAGETKLMAFFVGQVMKRSKGKADPKGVQPVLREKLR